jgi:hypothetical protein
MTMLEPSFAFLIDVSVSIVGISVGMSLLAGNQIPTDIPTNSTASTRPLRTALDGLFIYVIDLGGYFGRFRTCPDRDLVPLAGIEPALLAELDFESSASTNSATGARLRGARGS